MKSRVPAESGRGWRALTALLLISLALPAAHRALADEPPAGGSAPTAPDAAALAELPALVIESDPTGAVVILRGPYEWVGQTPWRLFREVSGLYHVEARIPGYDTWRDDVVLGPGGVSKLTIHLGRKTRTKALARDLLLPGWGQWYLESRTKGGLLMGATLGALGGLFWTHELYQNEVDDFDQARADYETSRNEADLPRLRRAVERASNDADRAYNRRTLVMGIAGGIYAVSLLDVLYFTPGGGATVTAPPLMRMEDTG